MVFNSKSKASNYGAQEGTPKAGTWVPGGKNKQPYDFSNKQSTAAKVDLENKEGANTQNGKIYKRNQLAIDIMKALFIAEGEEKFEKMSLRGKMTLIAKEGDEDFTNWFYMQGASDTLPGTWEVWKNHMLNAASAITA